MSFPILESVTNANYASSSSYGVVLPATINAGDLIRIKVVGGGVNAFNAVAGWTALYNTNNAINMIFACYQKIADGTEGGTTVTVTRTGSNTGASQVERWSGFYGDLAQITVAGPTTANTSNPNPPSVTAAWGSGDNAFIEEIFMAGSVTLTVASTNFSNIQNSSSASSSIGSAYRSTATDTQDPDATSISGSGFVASYTVVLRPATPTPVITNVNGDDEVEISASTTINGTGLDLVTSNGVRLQDSTATYTQVQTINTQSGTAINISSLSIGGVPRTSASHQIQVRVTDGSNPDSINVDVLDAAGFVTTEIQSDLGDDTSLAYLINGGTVANGSQLYGPTTTRGGATITYFADGHFVTGPGGTEPDYIDDIQLWTAAGGWTVAQDVQINSIPSTSGVAFINGLLVSASGALQCIDSAQVGSNYANGIPISSSGAVYIDELGSSSCPSGSEFVNGLVISPSHRLCVTLATPAGTNYINGLRLRADGAVYVTTDPVEDNDAFVNGGIVVSSRGQLRIAV